MKTFFKEICLSAFMGFVIPGIILALFSETQEITEYTENPVQSGPTQQPVQQPCSILIKTSQEAVEEMDLEKYLVGVVLGEMPVSFEKEALKAQAVVARTFALRSQNCSKHPDADVCTDSSCCQAYLSPDNFRKQGGTEEDLQRITQVVQDTCGQVLTYNGELIEATYFSCSGGRTEDAVAVWGTDVPYLRATDSPGEENAAHFRDSISFSKEDLEKKLGVVLSGPAEDWLGALSLTEGGGVERITIGGVSFRGTELRSKLGLRSTLFTAEADGKGVTFLTQGFGHRVGMSQYGADAMAAAGKKYTEILLHYYHGAELKQIQD